MYTILSGISAITALVPEDRIHAFEAPQNTARPYIVHQPISHIPILTHEGVKRLRAWDFYQITVYDDNRGRGNTIAEAIYQNLPGNYSGVWIEPKAGSAWYRPSGSEDERFTVGVGIFPLDFEVWEALAA